MRGLIDEKGRLGGKLSVIDLAIVLIVVLIAIGAFLKFMVLEQTAVTVEAASVRYTIELQNVRDWTVNNIREGDTLFVTGTAVGTVVRTWTAPHETLIEGDGVSWWGEVPERFVLFIEVEATATVTDGRVMVSRTVPMGVGNSGVHFTTRYAQFNATVKELTVYE